MNRCGYGVALLALRDGEPMPDGYEFMAKKEWEPVLLRSHDKFCRECCLAPDSMHPDADHIRNLRGAA